MLYGYWQDIGGPLQMVKYNLSIPGPSQYQVGSTLTKKGASMKPRLADLSLKYIKDVIIKQYVQIPGPGAYSVPSSISNGEKNPF